MSSDGLRARFRQRQTEPNNSVELGASSANAYFISKRISKRVPRKNKPPPLKKQQTVAIPDVQTQRIAPSRQDVEEREEDDELNRILQLPLHSQLLAELRAVDEQGKPQDRCFESHFSAWKSELLGGYNLLFYGLGSKLSLLQKFASSFLSDGVVIQVYGYLPVVSLKYLAQTIQEKILQIDLKPNQSLVHQCRDIAKTKPSSRHMLQIYLLVHSIDGLALRNSEAQTCLSWLAKAPFIALIASMDHINGPSIWKEEDSLRFEWLHQNLDTFEPYTDEIELRLTKRSKTADASSNGVNFILQSLTPTDVATLQELARQQLAATDSSKKRYQKIKHKLVPYHSVYDACRKKLLHSTPLAMKNSVKCLEDHGLLKQSRVDTVEYLEIPLPELIVRTDILREEAED
ncbi:unnamed protein product [Peronospora effusa]|uniref:Origin recognition complex subunit 2 n=1 Tax=Peronospora effusa TaxID=542832 RepID=A0A3M6VE72_9STRA|nr:hypothetical protein DD238_005385 [Peronospora effusa]RQM13764.1 hypothetical protein DD237_006063 [Peronospora effusa]CAI5707418.1 unnamed protein product [Peronospora effusa]